MQQGQIGDCYFPAAIAAIAQPIPTRIQNMIKDNGDGTYTVTFKQNGLGDRAASRTCRSRSTATSTSRSYGGPLYGAQPRLRHGEKMELWFPLVEKAYAQWKGSYDTIGNGGVVHRRVRGGAGRARPQSTDVSYDAARTAIWNADQARRRRASSPIGAGTHGEDQEALYTNTGVYANHAYSVLGYSRRTARSTSSCATPGARASPRGDGKNDGIFKLKLDDFTKLYQSLVSC